MSDDDADNEFRKHVLGCVQVLVFAIAILILIMTDSMHTTIGDGTVEKTKYELKAEVETAMVLPKTLQAQTEMMPFAGATIAMVAVYGTTDDGRKVWCATFIDSDEAMAWVQASKVFGRAVNGAVIAKQTGVVDGTGKDGGEAAQKPN